MQRCKKEHCQSLRHGELFIPCHLIQRTSQTYHISDTPKALARPRFSSATVYDSQKEFKLVKGIELRSQHRQQEQFDNVLHFDIDFYFKLPADKKTKLKREQQKYHTFTPDLSNLIKMVEDLCVDVGIIKDDAIIASVFSRKLYDSGEARTEFVITQIKTYDTDEYK